MPMSLLDHSSPTKKHLQNRTDSPRCRHGCDKNPFASQRYRAVHRAIYHDSHYRSGADLWAIRFRVWMQGCFIVFEFEVETKIEVHCCGEFFGNIFVWHSQNFGWFRSLLVCTILIHFVPTINVARNCGHWKGSCLNQFAWSSAGWRI